MERRSTIFYVTDVDFRSTLELEVDKKSSREGVPMFREKRREATSLPLWLLGLVTWDYADFSGGLMKASHEVAYRFRY